MIVGRFVDEIQNDSGDRLIEPVYLEKTIKEAKIDYRLYHRSIKLEFQSIRCSG